MRLPTCTSALCLMLLLPLSAHAQETAAPVAAPQETPAAAPPAAAPLAVTPAPVTPVPVTPAPAAPVATAPAPAEAVAAPADATAAPATTETAAPETADAETATPDNAAPAPANARPVSRTLRLNQLAMPTDLPIGTKRHDISSSGEIRSFLVHVPKALPERGRLTLVFSFHPAGLTAADQELLSGFSDVADQKGFIVVYPEGRGESPNWAWRPGAAGEQDIQFVADMISYVATMHRLSARSIFATGMGSGAQMAARIACIMPKTIAGVGLVAGNYPQWDDCVPRPLSAIIFHGTKDHLMPYSGRVLLRGGQGYAERMARFNNCATGPSQVMNEGDTRAFGWTSCLVGTEVLFFAFDGKGHGWPGSKITPAEDTSQTIDASAAMWEFFSTHPQQRYMMPRQRR